MSGGLGMFTGWVCPGGGYVQGGGTHPRHGTRGVGTHPLLLTPSGGYCVQLASGRYGQYWD